MAIVVTLFLCHLAWFALIAVWNQSKKVKEQHGRGTQLVLILLNNLLAAFAGVGLIGLVLLGVTFEFDLGDAAKAMHQFFRDVGR